jgi:hypothetical protein
MQKKIKNAAKTDPQKYRNNKASIEQVRDLISKMK